MTIYVDSAIIEEVQQAASWGWIGRVALRTFGFSNAF